MALRLLCLACYGATLLVCAAVAALLAGVAYALQGLVDPRVQALAGILTFLLIPAVLGVWWGIKKAPNQVPRQPA